MTIRNYIALIALVGSVSGCELIDLARADRPSGPQRQAIGEIFGHLGGVANVLGDPGGAQDSDYANVFSVAPYIKLLAPDNFATASSSGALSRAPADPNCVTSEGNRIGFDCAINVQGNECRVVGSGVEQPAYTYTGEATLEGEQCGPTTVTAAFTLDIEAKVADGTLGFVGNVDGEIELDATLSDITFCDNGLPNGGSLTVEGQGVFRGKPFGPAMVTVEFSEVNGECGVSTLR